MKKLECIMSILMVTFAIGFNLWLYRAEPIAMVDPNDNSFQYGLVERTNEIWDYADKTCPKKLAFSICHLALLVDHWVPNWAEGYNLPYYYSHVPQIAIVGSYRALSPLMPNAKCQMPNQCNNGTMKQFNNFSLFQYYHWIIYLLLCFFPISMFLALRILKLSWLTAGVGALLASHISTDGLYGMDPPSFIWRGWGLSSQLFAMIFMPLALAYGIRFIVQSSSLREILLKRGGQIFADRFPSLTSPSNESRRDRKTTSGVVFNQSIASSGAKKFDHPAKDWVLAVLFITLTTMGHLGLGLMLFLSIPMIAFTQPLTSFLNQQSLHVIWQESKEALIKTIHLALPPILLLSYWIIPTLLGDAYHNVSFWDPIWKFNSYGAKEVLVNLWNGFLFDWGRLPIFTALVFVGLFASLRATCEKNTDQECREQNSYVEDKNDVTRRGTPIEPPQPRIVPPSSPFLTFMRCLCGQKTDKNSKEVLRGEEVGWGKTRGSMITPLPFLFVFFLLLYFGKTTWEGILDLIPSMSQFHQHRFIVGVHLVGLFLAPIGVMWVTEQFVRIIRSTIYDVRGTNNNQKNHTSYFVLHTSTLLITIILMAILIPPIYKQTISYGSYNEILIKQANNNFLKQKVDAELLITTLKSLMKDHPGRVFAGRGGSWGKDFRVAETAYFMYLSANGIPTVLWLPETWSNNSDTEQYFSEDVPDHYSLYNIRYVVTPALTNESFKGPQKFWKLIKETSTWKLYEVSLASPLSSVIASSAQVQRSNLYNKDRVVPQSGTRDDNTSGYISAGSSPSIVFSDKLSFGNVIRLWIQSPYPGKGIFPELQLTGKKLASQGVALRSYLQLPHFFMLDEASYKTPDAKIHSLFAEPPQYMTPWEWPEAFSQIYKSDKSTNPTNQFNNVTIQQCNNCIQILSQSSDMDMVFRATVEVKEACPTCVVVLKQTYHPSWSAFIRKISDDERGEPKSPELIEGPVKPPVVSEVEPINVFPSFVGVRLEEPGTYEIVFSYTPSLLKIVLLGFGTLFGITGIILHILL